MNSIVFNELEPIVRDEFLIVNNAYKKILFPFLCELNYMRKILYEKHYQTDDDKNYFTYNEEFIEEKVSIYNVKDNITRIWLSYSIDFSNLLKDSTNEAKRNLQIIIYRRATSEDFEKELDVGYYVKTNYNIDIVDINKIEGRRLEDKIKNSALKYQESLKKDMYNILVLNSWLEGYDPNAWYNNW